MNSRLTLAGICLLAAFGLAACGGGGGGTATADNTGGDAGRRRHGRRRRNATMEIRTGRPSARDLSVGACANDRCRKRRQAAAAEMSVDSRDEIRDMLDAAGAGRAIPPWRKRMPGRFWRRRPLRPTPSRMPRQAKSAPKQPKLRPWRSTTPSNADKPRSMQAIAEADKQRGDVNDEEGTVAIAIDFSAKPSSGRYGHRRRWRTSAEDCLPMPARAWQWRSPALGPTRRIRCTRKPMRHAANDGGCANRLYGNGREDHGARPGPTSSAKRMS